MGGGLLVWACSQWLNSSHSFLPSPPPKKKKKEKTTRCPDRPHPLRTTNPPQEDIHKTRPTSKQAAQLLQVRVAIASLL